MSNISLHVALSESFVKNLAQDVAIYAAVLFVVMLVAAFAAGLVLGRFWTSRENHRRGPELSANSLPSEPPSVS